METNWESSDLLSAAMETKQLGTLECLRDMLRDLEGMGMAITGAFGDAESTWRGEHVVVPPNSIVRWLRMHFPCQSNSQGMPVLLAQCGSPAHKEAVALYTGNSGCGDRYELSTVLDIEDFLGLEVFYQNHPPFGKNVLEDWDPQAVAKLWDLYSCMRGLIRNYKFEVLYFTKGKDEAQALFWTKRKNQQAIETDTPFVLVFQQPVAPFSLREMLSRLQDEFGSDVAFFLPPDTPAGPEHCAWSEVAERFFFASADAELTIPFAQYSGVLLDALRQLGQSHGVEVETISSKLEALRFMACAANASMFSCFPDSLDPGRGSLYVGCFWMMWRMIDRGFAFKVVRTVRLRTSSSEWCRIPWGHFKVLLWQKNEGRVGPNEEREHPIGRGTANQLTAAATPENWVCPVCEEVNRALRDRCNCCRTKRPAAAALSRAAAQSSAATAAGSGAVAKTTRAHGTHSLDYSKWYNLEISEGEESDGEGKAEEVAPSAEEKKKKERADDNENDKEDAPEADDGKDVDSGDGTKLIELLLAMICHQDGHVEDADMASKRQRWMDFVPVQIGASGPLLPMHEIFGICEKGPYFQKHEDYKHKVERLVRSGTSLNVRCNDHKGSGYYGAMAIHLAACWKGCCYPAKNGCGAARDLMKLLIKHRSDTTARTYDGYTPLYLAALWGHGCENTAKLLLKHGADARAISYKDAPSSSLYSVLHAAALGGSQDIVKDVLEHQADMSSRDAEGQTALHASVAKGHEGIVHLLLDRLANIHALTNKGRNVLWYAANNGKEHLVRHLVSLGAKPHQVDNNGVSPVGAAHSQIAQFLNHHIDAQAFSAYTPDELRQRGNTFFKQKAWIRAARYYEAAVSHNPSQELVVTLHANRAQCFLHLGLYSAAIEAATAAIGRDRKCFKALYRRALACGELLQFGNALHDLENILTLDAHHREALVARDEFEEDARKTRGRCGPANFAWGNLHLVWGVSLGERRYKWLADCYRLRIRDDFDWGRRSIHGGYDWDMFIDQKILPIAESLSAFSKMAVARQLIPNGWDWSKFIDIASARFWSCLGCGFDEKEFENMYKCPRALVFMRATAAAIYGGSSQSINNMDEVGQTIMTQAARYWPNRSEDSFEAAFFAQLQLTFFEDIGGTQCWRALWMKLSVTRVSSCRCGSPNCHGRKLELETCAHCGSTGSKEHFCVGSTRKECVKCSACKAEGIDTRYCSPLCQKEDWKLDHKRTCPASTKKSMAIPTPNSNSAAVTNV